MFHLLFLGYNSDYFRNSLTVGYTCSVCFSRLFQGQIFLHTNEDNYLQKLPAKCRYTSIKTCFTSSRSNPNVEKVIVIGAKCKSIRGEMIKNHAGNAREFGCFEPFKNFKQGNGVMIFLVKKITRSSMENELEETRLESKTSFSIILLRKEKSLH